jgi:hypothetical protein
MTEILLQPLTLVSQNLTETKISPTNHLQEY